MTTHHDKPTSAHERLAGARQTLDRVSTAERVAALVRENIIDGTFPPGTRLSEPDICSALDVSRNTLREAFRHLAKDQLVTHKLNRGVFVRVPTLDDVAELYRCRRVVECAAIRTFATDSADLRSVEEALAMATEAGTAEDWTSVGTADIHFHRAITALAGSSRINSLMDGVWAELRLAFLAMGDPRQFHTPYLERNRTIAALLRSGSTAEAERALFDYLTDAEREITAQYEKHLDDLDT